MNAKDATKQLMEMGCKYLRIVSADGDVVLYQNPAKDSSPSAVKAHADKICSYIQKAPAGTYIVQGRTSPQARPTSVPVVKEGDSPVPMAGPVEKMPDVLSYGAALKMQEEIANLRAENARLLSLVESLEADLADMETMAEGDGEPAPANPIMEQLAGMAAVLPALVDRYFENQKEAREIEKMKIAAMYQQQQRQNPTPSHEGY